MKSFSTFVIETKSGGGKSDSQKELGKNSKKLDKNTKSGNQDPAKALAKKQAQMKKKGAEFSKEIERKRATDWVNTEIKKDIDRKKAANRGVKSRKSVNTKKTKSSNTPTTGKNVVDVVDKSGKNVKVDLDSPKFDNSQQMRDIESDPQSKQIRKDIERQTNTKTREFTQKSGVTKGNDSASINRRLSAGTLKGDQLARAYGTAGTTGDSNMGAGAGGASGNTKAAKPKPLIPSSDVEMLKKTNIKSGGKVTVNFAEPPKLEKPAVKLYKTSTKADPKTGSRIPDPKKGELGKLYKTSTKVDPKRGGSVRTTDKINQELTAKRQARIDPTTGKATPKGVENFAINQQTKGLSTKGDAGRKAMANAKKIASNPSSKAYKDIETKINTSDYAGKRAKLASTKELDKIAKDLKTSPTISGKAPSRIKQPLSPPKFPISGARTGKVTPFTKTSGIKYKDFANKASKSKFKLSKLSAKTVAGKAVAPAFAIWNFRDNYKNTKGSRLRKFTKAALKTGAYYAGATGGAAVGTAGGSFTGPGAFVTGTAGAIAGGETAANLTDKLFNKIWKPPTTKGKGKGGGGGAGGSGNKGNFKWKSGISIGPGKK